MKKNVRFYICPICGNQVGLIRENGNMISCCGKDMELMKVNENEELLNYEIVGDKINVTINDIEQDNQVIWVALVGEHKTSRVTCIPDEKTDITFDYIPESSLYCYSDKHGLIEASIK